jgi:NADPH:quinone reductase-like Zn-dependent oxidoreductase
VELVHSLGADHIIDYTQEDFVTSGQHYDLILSLAGYRSIFEYKRALSPQGIYVSGGGAMAQVFQGLLLGSLISKGTNKTLTFLYAKQNQQDLVTLKEMIEAGKIRSVIDRRYPLSEAAEALQYYGEGRSQGKVVITMEHNGNGGD